MAQQRFLPGSAQSFIQRGGDAFTLGVAVDSYCAWRLRVVAHLQEGPRFVGEVITLPSWYSGLPEARALAAGCLPGAQAWEVLGAPLSPITGQNNTLDIDLSIANGIAQPSWLELERRRCIIYTGDEGSITLHPWERLKSWYARTTAGGTIDLGDQPTITLDAGTSLAADFYGPTAYGLTIDLVGTALFVLQVEG